MNEPILHNNPITKSNYNSAAFIYDEHEKTLINEEEVTTMLRGHS